MKNQLQRCLDHRWNSHFAHLLHLKWVWNHHKYPILQISKTNPAKNVNESRLIAFFDSNKMVGDLHWSALHFKKRLFYASKLIWRKSCKYGFYHKRSRTLFINCDSNAWFENKAFWSVICKHTISGSLTTSAKTDAKKKVPFFWLIIAQGENISKWNKDKDALETWVYFQYFSMRGTLGISPIQKHNIKAKWICDESVVRIVQDFKINKNEHRRVYQKLGLEFKNVCH